MFFKKIKINYMKNQELELTLVSWVVPKDRFLENTLLTSSPVIPMSIIDRIESFCFSYIRKERRKRCPICFLYKEYIIYGPHAFVFYH